MAFEWLVLTVIFDLARIDFAILVIKIESLFPFQFSQGFSQIEHIEYDYMVIVNQMKSMLQNNELAILYASWDLDFIKVFAKQL